MDDGVWDATVYSKNRERMMKADMARLFFQAVVQEAREEGLLSDEHFSVDGTLSISMASNGRTKRTHRRRTRTRASTKRGRAKKPNCATPVMC